LFFPSEEKGLRDVACLVTAFQSDIPPSTGLCDAVAVCFHVCDCGHLGASRARSPAFGWPKVSPTALDTQDVA
jgi:hypothetical protein